jgi:hypothetical protein
MLRGRAFVVVEPYVLAGPGEADALVAPLRALGPEIDMFHTIPMTELVHAHMDPEHPVPGHGDHQLLDDVTPETIDAIIGAAGTHAESPLLMVELRQLGGAIARQLGGHGATASIDAAFATFVVGIAATPEMGAAVATECARVRDALAPWDAGRQYLNFAEQPTDTSKLFDPTSYARLRAIKAAVDPHGLFVANHRINPA